MSGDGDGVRDGRRPGVEGSEQVTSLHAELKHPSPEGAMCSENDMEDTLRGRVRRSGIWFAVAQVLGRWGGTVWRPWEAEDPMR